MSIFSSTTALAIFAAMFGSLFASADTALNTLPEAQLQALIEDGEPEFRRYARDRLRVLSRWLVMRVVSISVAAGLFEASAEDIWGKTWAAVTAVAAPVLVYGTCAEALSTLARRRPEQIGRWALYYLQPFEWAVAPLAEPLAALGRWLGSRVPEASTAGDATLTETEVEWAITQGERAGALDKEPATMIRNVLDFKHLTAHEVMVPRRRVSGIEISTPLEDVVDHVSKDGHSRYPVYLESLDNIVGLVYVKDLFDVARSKRLHETTLQDWIRNPVLFVAESQSALSVLREMRTRRLHLAVVSDEFGGTGGIVTLEDIIEEIVGEINDEYDIEDPLQVQKLAEGRFVADAEIALGDLESHLGCAMPNEGDFESLGGLIVHRAGRVPDEGTSLVIGDYTMIVREADGKRVVKVEIVRSEPSLVPPDEAGG